MRETRVKPDHERLSVINILQLFVILPAGSGNALVPESLGLTN